MGDLHIIKGGSGGQQQPGLVEQVLANAKASLNDENTEMVVVIALKKPYPQALGAQLFWSAGDNLRLFGLLTWAVNKIHALVG